jgi:membrane protease subunit (stomatin/prohibitin family)
MTRKALEQEPAHWTKDFICSNCGCKCYPFDIDFGDYNYCPNCGCAMVEPQKSEDT